jgi:hypothetical protein
LSLQYFHADDGRGLGASHQTGWTGLVAYHIAQSGVTCRLPKTPRSASSVPLPLPPSLTDQLRIAPRSLARHYFDDTMDSRSEYDDSKSLMSAYSQYETHSQLGDVSPEAL